jgi:hypothetical protein
MLPVFFSDKMLADSRSFSPSASKPEKVVESWKKLGITLKFIEPKPTSFSSLCEAHEPEYVRAVLDGKRANGPPRANNL